MEEGGARPEAPGGGAAAALAAPARGRYSEAWEYFHLPLAPCGLPPGRYATCRLCGRQVSGGAGLGVGTAALWSHLTSAHRRELDKSGPRAPAPPAAAAAPPEPPAAHGDWGRLVEQVEALALRASLRERELERRERALERRERALDFRRRAVEEEEQELAEKRQELRAESERLRARLLGPGPREAAPPPAPGPPALVKEEHDERADAYLVTRALF